VTFWLEAMCLPSYEQRLKPPMCSGCPFGALIGVTMLLLRLNLSKNKNYFSFPFIISKKITTFAAAKIESNNTIKKLKIKIL
jgi:hypothetical protein